MTALIGDDGAITLPSGVHDGIINRWQATFASVTSETTGFTDSTLRRNRLGMLSCEGSATGLSQFDAANTSPGVGDIIAGGSSLVLTVATGCTYTITAAFNSIAHDVVKLGDSGLIFNFVNGDADTLTIAWDESA